MSLIALIVLPLIGSFIAASLPAKRSYAAWLAAVIGVIGLINLVSHYRLISEHQALVYHISYLPQLGFDFIFRLDALAFLFSLLIHCIFILVVVYSRYYMSKKDPVPRFFAFLLFFIAAMQGIVISWNLIQIVIFWELTSLASFLLIAYWHHRADARRGARMSLTITAMGGLCLLASFILLGKIAGGYSMDDVLNHGAAIRQNALFTPCLILFAIGVFSKSAQFPLHFWLPHAMAAPTPVSALLHSATLVKAGIFLMMRFWPVFSDSHEWQWIIGTAGVSTMLLGAFIAIFQHDLKGLLAYSTISHLGLITTLLAMNTPLALVAAIFHTLNHAAFKASLFMATGIIDHETGTRDMRRLQGLFKVMPYTSTLAIVASAAMAGVPLLNGFLSKEMFFSQTLVLNSHWLMPSAALIMGICAVAYSLRFAHIFFGALPKDLSKTPRDPARWVRFPIELLVLSCLIIGILPGVSVGHLLALASSSVLADNIPHYSLRLWHGFNLALLMSFVAIIGGALLYFILRFRFDLLAIDKVPFIHRFKGKQAYENTLLWLASSASFLEKRLSSPRLQTQLLLLLALAIGISLLIARAYGAIFQHMIAFYAIDPFFTLLWVIACCCAIAAARQAKFHRLTALLLIGGTGIVVSLTFLWLSAPDLALTQLMVETITVVLLLLGLRWLPIRISSKKLNIQASRRDRLRRLRDFIIAVGAGLSMALLSYFVLMLPTESASSQYYLRHALSDGHGSNVVNVILVDFRGFDTLGEITVLSIVALTVYALLRRFRPALESLSIPIQQQQYNIDFAAKQTPEKQVKHGYLMVAGMYLRLLFPFMLLIAAYFFLRGHHMPGGGFVAGLIVTSAIVLQYMLLGTQALESRLNLQPHRLIANGLWLASLTAFAAVLLGQHFLSSLHGEWLLPLLLEKIQLSSTLLFDLGVFLAVLGACLLILTALAHQSVRSRRLLEKEKGEWL